MKISVKKLLQVIFLSNIFEWYEFTVYAFLAVEIGQVFFNASNGTIAVIESFALFAVSYLVRPIGSFFFGYLGDKINAGTSLKYSLLLMALPTFFIGILPSYNTYGILAPILLVILRLIQGFAAGGELPTSASYAYIYSDSMPNKNLFCSLVGVGGMVGVLLASFSIFILNICFSKTELIDWAWRIPFILGLPITFIILKVRKSIILELPKDNIELKVEKKLSLNIRALIYLKAILLVSFLQVSFYILFVWLPLYLEIFLKVPHNYAKLSNVISLICLIFATTFFGYIARYINYKKLISSSIFCTLLLSYPLFYLLHQMNLFALIIAQIIFVIIIAPIQGNYIFALGKLFKRNINMGMALSFTIPTALFGGTAPVICSYYIKFLNYSYFPSLYLVIFSLLAVPVIYSL